MSEIAASAATPLSASSAASAEVPLSPNLLRNLGDRSYDKRKSAALEVENLVKQLAESNNPISKESIPLIIDLLQHQFTCSKNANYRKGGLIGLAGTAIGLMHDAKLYLDLLMPPVLKCFDDPESRVRYYACESLYNIAKVARQDILKYFNQIFDGLCKLFADVDVDVKNGANLLDRLVKDIVTESEVFDVELFIPLLHKYIRMTNPYIRQLIVGWITVLDSVPDIEMLEWLPEFLDGLFNMLSDGNREIRQAADSALSEFLREIKNSPFVDFGPMVHILVLQSQSKERFTRLTAATWIQEFVSLGKERLVRFYGDLLGAILHCISDSETEIRIVGERANADLLAIVKATQANVDLMPLMSKLNVELLSDIIATRMATLTWINMLLEKTPTQITVHINSLLPSLLKTLNDPSDAVVLLDLEVLSRLSTSLNPDEFSSVLQQVIQLFATDSRLLEKRGSMIIRKLCTLLEGKGIYMVLATVLSAHEDLDFVSLMVHTLNLILLTAAELEHLRSILRRSFNEDASQEDIDVFTTLFKTWCHNPVSTFSLCLLAHEIDASVGFLMQIDKLVQLLESPIFISLRIQLLETHQPNHASLMKSMYGLLMLLPQSSAFRTLRDRLASVTQMTMAIARSDAPLQAEKDDPKIPVLLGHFDKIQSQHTSLRHKALAEKSVLNRTTP
ncbi:VAC14 family protein [Thraustotheca clavata]|uniref:VAC14 family protein n=1 Tax=Thraustotheca clavata TaxID=74557 RepID=A0A1V9Z9V4_9STRA|nr:VAC14 family protein [Thraustotheca clavata]